MSELSQDGSAQIKKIRTLLWDEGVKWTVRSFYLAATAAVIFMLTPVGEQARDVWNAPTNAIESELESKADRQRIEKETKEKLDLLDDKMDLVLQKISQLTGENRVTFQPEDMSYVKEPAYFREPIMLVLFIGYTEMGSGCILKEEIPQFTDENDVTLSLPPRKPRTQFSTTTVRRQYELDQPIGLIPGRTRVNLQLEYVCDGETIFENTDPVFYYALAERPEDP